MSSLLTGGYIPTKQTAHEDGFFNPYFDTAEGRAQSGYNGPGPVWSMANGGFVQPAQSPPPQVAAQAPAALPSATAMPDGGGYTSQNPYLSDMANDMGRRTQQGLDQSFNAIHSHSAGVGGLGGSRQAVAEGIATRGAMDNLQGNLASLFGGQYNADANRNLSQYGMDQNFYTAQRGQDLTQTGLGANIYQMAQNGGWTGLNNASNLFNTTAGNNVSTNSGTQQGGGLLGAAGGALGGAQLGNLLGNPTPTPAPKNAWDWTGSSWAF